MVVQNIVDIKICTKIMGLLCKSKKELTLQIMVVQLVFYCDFTSTYLEK